MSTRILSLSALAAVTLALVRSLAAAPEVTRGSYRGALEPICKTDTQADERIFARVKDEVRGDKLKPAAAQFTKAARFT